MKYISYYDTNEFEGRNYCLAATNKMDYICKTIVESGDTVEIISASMTSSKGNFNGGTYSIAEGITLKKFSAYKWGNIFQKIWVTVYSFWTLFFYLLFHSRKSETILVYHAFGYMSAISLAKFFKGFRLILEVEEIYGDVSGNKKDKERELLFFQKADGYVFPTQLLNEKINAKNKPHVIIHGTYNVEKQIAEKFSDGRIHCVYAGTFDPRKGGVAAAVSAGEFLDERYHIHILGFGSDKDKKLLIDTIDELSKKTKCKITYDGLLSGEEYIKFIQSCHIGLSTQNPDAEFNDTSFPSKILSYLANGLRVVSVKIPVLEGSSINDILYYYENKSPKDIAVEIKSINLNTAYDSRRKIEKLNVELKINLKVLLG